MTRAKEMRDLPLAIDVSSSGNVGIGTNNPARPLNIVNDAGSNPIQSIRNSSLAWSQYALTRYGTEGEDVRYMDFGYYRGSGEPSRGLVIKSQANATLVTFLDSGNVGIGTATPSTLLHVQAGSTGNGTIRVGGGAGLEISHDNAGHTIQRIDSLYRTTSNSTNLQLRTGTFTVHTGSSNTERMRIDPSGRLTVGSIGTDTTLSGGQPALQVTGSGFNGYMASVRRDTSAYASGLILAKSRNTTADNFTKLQDNDQIGSIIFIGDDGTDLDTYGATIQAEVNGTPAANNMPTDLIFSTNSGTSTVTERMRIDKNGNVMIGGAATLGKHTVKIDTNKNIAYSGAIGEVGNVPSLYAVNDAGSSLVSLGFRGTDIRFATQAAERVRIADGGLTLYSTIGTNSSTAFTSMNGRIGFDTDYSDTQRGPNKIVLQNDGSWVSGLGISSNSTDIYTGGEISFQKSVDPQSAGTYNEMAIMSTGGMDFMPNAAGSFNFKGGGGGQLSIKTAQYTGGSGTSIGTSNIQVVNSAFGALVFVAGYGNGQFCDLVYFGYNASPTIIAQQTIAGSPPSRIYTGSGYALYLRYSSGSLTTKVNYIQSHS